MTNYQEVSDQTEHIIMRSFLNLTQQLRVQLEVEAPAVKEMLNQKADEIRRTSKVLTTRLAAELIHTATTPI